MGKLPHIELSRVNKLFLIAPATANIIGKMANGIADDLLTTTFLGFPPEKVIIAPAMNSRMYDNPIVQENIKRLANQGYKFIEPESGFLACREEGKGRLASVSKIVEVIESMLLDKQDLVGKKILITAGPTKEPIDDVRFISNHSTGKMGYALAKMARNRGAVVFLVSGPTMLEPPSGVNIFYTDTAMSMYRKVKELFIDSDIFISAAAVSDFRPEEFINGKIKKENKNTLTLNLVRNIDILKEMGREKGEKIVVGFAAESDHLMENSKRKIKEKNLDLIIANPINEKGAGFGEDTNKIKIIDKNGNISDYPLLSKEKVADVIFDKISEFLK